MQRDLLRVSGIDPVMSMSIVSSKAEALNCIFSWKPGLRSWFSLTASAVRFSVSILSLQMGKEGTKRLYNITMVIQSFIKLGIDVVLKIQTFSALSCSVLAMPARASNLVDWGIWCWGLFFYAICVQGCVILMSFHLVPWTTHLYWFCCPKLPEESSSTNLCPSQVAPRRAALSSHVPCQHQEQIASLLSPPT